jgi:hypothetical protein
MTLHIREIKKMKKLLLGLSIAALPAFASNAACPQLQATSLIGCQALDSMLTSLSGSSLSGGYVSPTVAPVTDLAASLMLPTSVSQPVVVPAVVSAPTGYDPLSILRNSALTTVSSLAFPQPTPVTTPTPIYSNQYYSAPQVSVVSAVTNSFGGSQISLSSLVMPYQYLGLISPTFQSPTVGNFAGTAPETSSIAMMGAGLLLLGIARRKWLRRTV